eukprot:snap_masked-scaffold_2-processed-gene-27.24-mRNA-1 protein AED:1.00 eAED:1.00 QI:0/0/0/0/1/1/2/0/388
MEQNSKEYSRFGYYLFAFGVGALLPITASINATLIEPLNNPMAPGFISFATSFLTLCLLFCLRPGDQKKSERAFELENPTKVFNKENFHTFITSTRLYYLYLIPGFLGAFYIALAPFLGKKIGYNLFFVILISGQMLSSVIADYIGFQGLPKRTLTAHRGIGLSLVVIGAVLTVVDGFLDNLSIGTIFIYIILSILCGAVFGTQPAMNSKLTKELDTQPHRVGCLGSFVSIFWTALFMAVAIPITDEELNFKGLSGLPVWKFTGGILASTFVFGSIILARKIGVSIFVSLTIAGQLTISSIIDSFGLLEADQVDLSVLRIMGTFVVVFAVVFLKLEKTNDHKSTQSQEQITTSDGTDEEKSDKHMIPPQPTANAEDGDASIPTNIYEV